MTHPLTALRLRLLTSLGTLALVACLGTSPAATATDATVAEYSLDHQGLSRSYRLYTPPAVADGKPLPLILALHGGYGTGKNMEEMSHLNTPAGREGFVVAYPDGVSRSWNAGDCCGPAMKRQVDDVGFLKAVVQDIGRHVAIDPARIYATGHSNGAMMAHRLACEAPSLLAAIAPVAGGLMLADCPTRQPISALMIQGRADPRIPWNGGEFEGNFRPALRDVVARVGQRDRCDSAEQTTLSRGIVECKTLSGCPKGVEVSWCGLDGIGHQWPGGRTYLPRLLGENTNAFDASETIVRFFKTH